MNIVLGVVDLTNVDLTNVDLLDVDFKKTLIFFLINDCNLALFFLMDF